jgi:squalene-associated FAD-dependent desaturase
MMADVVVIGGGIAGLATAVQLSEAGLVVVVVEEAPRLGGRASAFTDQLTGERVDNGQHVLFGCYHETYRFLRTIGTDALAPLDRRLSVAIAGEDRRPAPLTCPGLPAPWHLAAAILKWNAVPLRDRVRALAIARALRSDKDPAALSSITVSAWLRVHRQPASLCRWLWHPLAVAALNQSPESASAGPFVAVLRQLFGGRAIDSAIGVPRVPLDELFALPAAHYIDARGGRVLTKTSARIALDTDNRIAHVAAGDLNISTGIVVSAVPWHAITRIWERTVPAPMTAIASAAAAMDPLPILTANLWFDRPFMPAKFVGLVDGPMQWAFDKSRIFGGEAGHISMVSSGAVDIVDLDREAVTEMAKAQLERTLPAARGARLGRSIVVRERRATFSVAPGAPARPRTRTGLAGFFLAGDWTDTGLPGTIESAAISGRRAAEAVLEFRASGTAHNQAE